MNRDGLQSSILSFAFILFAATSLSGQTNVLTWHNDVARDGLNSTETVLRQNNVNPSHFGKLCSAVFDGQLFAQPLVVSTAGQNIVYVATMNNSVYAVNGSNCSQIAHVSLLPANEESVQCAHVGAGKCQVIAPLLGILGTPVIDTGTNTMYLVTETESTAGVCANTFGFPCFFHRLHALDLTTLTEKFNGPVTIAGSYQKVAFTSKNHTQRPGLLLLPGVGPNGDNKVYIGFSEMDGTGTPGKSVPHGFVFGYDAQNLATAPNVWVTTPTGEGGGVWQSGAGLAAGIDSPTGQTYLYVPTGDGIFNVSSGGLNYGDSFVKLTTNLSTVPNGYFTPFSQACMNPANEDFGSSGVMLLPDVGSKFYAIGAGKEGIIYVMDRANPGQFVAPTNSTCPAQGSNANQEYFQAATNKFYATSVYWNQYLFSVPNESPITRYPVSLSTPATCSPAPICTTGEAKSSISLRYGPQLSVSSSGTTTGTAIVWAFRGSGWPSATGNPPSTAQLYAYDAEHVTGSSTIPPLWNSQKCPTRDRPGNATKFVVPTVANGMVYLGTMDPTDSTNTRGRLDAFGLTTATCN